ncbi:hypothetical protein [Lysinibacillus sp. Ag94]|uniref:hypothetical protein n=1 Tax=Lysinibacillus sp. Ag94 TaxID=2936682 RepID=UPI00200CCB24|nr:hypothetical protein [Lysinibacillus sp. Ag94]UPW85151.1 hypothetical protein MY533_09995 [Lysinibacillus sp. Ag94]
MEIYLIFDAAIHQVRSHFNFAFDGRESNKIAKERAITTLQYYGLNGAIFGMFILIKLSIHFRVGGVGTNVFQPTKYRTIQ